MNYGQIGFIILCVAALFFGAWLSSITPKPPPPPPSISDHMASVYIKPKQKYIKCYSGGKVIFLRKIDPAHGRNSIFQGVIRIPIKGKQINVFTSLPCMLVENMTAIDMSIQMLEDVVNKVED